MKKFLVFLLLFSSFNLFARTILLKFVKHATYTSQVVSYLSDYYVLDSTDRCEIAADSTMFYTQRMGARIAELKFKNIFGVNQTCHIYRSGKMSQALAKVERKDGVVYLRTSKGVYRGSSLSNCELAENGSNITIFYDYKISDYQTILTYQKMGKLEICKEPGLTLKEVLKKE